MGMGIAINEQVCMHWIRDMITMLPHHTFHRCDGGNY
jgi:hypothetical protein